MRRLPALSLAITLLTTSVSASDWLPLFNGKDLSGWTVKTARHPLGENFANTWRVEDGILKVDYSDYQDFNMQVSHLYSNLPYSHYRLRLNYKFVEGHREDAPFWVVLNSGVMLHSQSPQSMELDQAFPVSIEAQFLAEGTGAGTQTGNVASPGTHIERDGQLLTDHIVDSTSRLYPIDEWVHFEIEVRGDQELVYFVNGKEVHRFQHPQLDPEDSDAKRLIDAGATIPLRHGHIALQAEGQNVWFRNIEIMPLNP
ncbi:conserved domain protein [Verrucomicrobiia bacterium DG1235]|nr:conserved domain protein [Verrucomicrobiae bacterium DG1235]